MVAGNTTSAILAVAVMNCSCTHTNKSSRAKPAFTLRCSGATWTGLVFWVNSTVTGGPSLMSAGSPVRIGPMRDWSSTRTFGSTTSRPSISVLFQ